MLRIVRNVDSCVVFVSSTFPNPIQSNIIVYYSVDREELVDHLRPTAHPGPLQKYDMLHAMKRLLPSSPTPLQTIPPFYPILFLPHSLFTPLSQ